MFYPFQAVVLLLTRSVEGGIFVFLTGAYICVALFLATSLWA
jgi:hypothetical protein